MENGLNNQPRLSSMILFLIMDDKGIKMVSMAVYGVQMVAGMIRRNDNDAGSFMLCSTTNSDHDHVDHYYRCIA